MGYVIQPINFTKRALFGIAGIGMFLPDKVISIGIPLAMIGLIIGLATLGHEWMSSRSTSGKIVK
jgi:hypothetical protein